jgi:hypothetical protein
MCALFLFSFRYLQSQGCFSQKPGWVGNSSLRLNILRRGQLSISFFFHLQLTDTAAGPVLAIKMNSRADGAERCCRSWGGLVELQDGSAVRCVLIVNDPSFFSSICSFEWFFVFLCVVFCRYLLCDAMQPCPVGLVVPCSRVRERQQDSGIQAHTVSQQTLPRTQKRAGTAPSLRPLTPSIERYNCDTAALDKRVRDTETRLPLNHTPLVARPPRPARSIASVMTLRCE